MAGAEIGCCDLTHSIGRNCDKWKHRLAASAMMQRSMNDHHQMSARA